MLNYLLSLLTSLCFDCKFIACPIEPVLKRHLLNCFFFILHGIVSWIKQRSAYLTSLFLRTRCVVMCCVLNVVILNKPDVSKYAILRINRSLILPETAICKKKAIFTHIERNLSRSSTVLVKFLGQAVRSKFTYQVIFFQGYNEYIQ